jgi:VanZ family protein
MRRFFLYWFPALVWMGVIFFLSTDMGSAAHTSRILEPLLRWLKPDISAAGLEQAHYLVRKGAHLSEYALLAILWWRVLAHVHAEGRVRPAWFCALIALLIATVYAATDEYHQTFVSSRGASFHDVMIDSCGALLGVILVLLWQGWRIHLARRA